MKICYIADMRSPHTMRWIEYFNTNHEISLISFDYFSSSDMFLSDIDYKNIGVKLYKIPKRSVSIALSIFAIRKLLKKIKPDIVHSHFLTHYGFLGALSGFHPLAVSPWGSDITRDPKNPVFNLTIKYALKRADVIQCMDDSFVDRIEVLTNNTKEIRMIPEGIDTERFKPVCEHNDNRIVNVLCLRKSQEPYNINILLYAIEKVIKDHNNTNFTMLNSGTDIENTINLIHTIGIEDHVNLIDVVPNKKIPDILNKADIYVDTYYKSVSGGGIGKTALEAMGCELPIVLSNSLGADLHIKHKENGYIYIGNDYKSLSNSIIELIENQDMRLKIGKNARRYVLSNQDFNENMKKMEQCYKELIK